jgi:hypothetical protein
MITFDLILKNLRMLLIIFLIVAGVWIYKDYQFQKSENIRQTENNRQTRISDSLHFTSQILTLNEIKDYLEYDNSDLKNKLAKDGIKTNRIKEIVSNTYNYKDTIIKKYIPGPFIDSTKCLTIKGFVDSSGVTITNRKFHNKTDAVAYWERKQWSFLGIKTRFLGKKQMTAKVYDECGETKTIKIEKRE